MNRTNESRNTSNQQGNIDVSLLRLNTKIFKMTEENVNVNKELLTEIKKMNKKLDDLFKVTLTDYVVNFPLSNNITYHKEEESLSYMYKEKISNFIFRMNPENLSVKDARDFIRKNTLKLGEMVSQDINNLSIDWSGNNISAPAANNTDLATPANMYDIGGQLTYLISGVDGVSSQIPDSQKYLLSIKNTDEQLTQLYIDYTSYELFTKNLLQAVEIIINEIQKINYNYSTHYIVLYDSLKDILNKLKYPRYYRVFTKNNYGGAVDLDSMLYSSLLNSITIKPSFSSNPSSAKIISGLTTFKGPTVGGGSGAVLDVEIGTDGKVTNIWVTRLGTTTNKLLGSVTSNPKMPLKTAADELLSSISSNPTDADNGSLTGLSTTTSGSGTGAVLSLTISGNTVSSVTVEKEWILSIEKQDITHSVGDTVTQVNSSKTWTMTINSSGITESQGVVVTQNGETGTLTTALQNVWTMTINSTTITKSQSVYVIQANGYMIWTMTINAATITESQGVVVTQNGATGTLTTALTGAGTVTVTITSAIGQIFDTNNDLVIDSGGTPTTVLAADVTNAVSVTTPDAVGTLKTPLTGASTTQVVIDCASGVVFDTETDLVIDSGGTPTTVSSGDVTAAVNSGATTTVTITSALTKIFDTNDDLVIDSGETTTTVLAADITNASSTSTVLADTVGKLKTALTGSDMTSVVITAAPDVIPFNSTTGVVIGTGASATTIANANINTVKETETNTGYKAGDTITVSKNNISGSTTDLVITLTDGDIFSVGSTFSNVATSSSPGSGAVLEIVVGSGGNTVSEITVTTAGTQYRIGDTLTVQKSVLNTYYDLIITLDSDDFVTDGSGYVIGDTITVNKDDLVVNTPSGDVTSSTDLQFTFGANSLEQNISEFVDRDYVRISGTMYNLNSNQGANSDFDYVADREGDKFDEISRIRAGFLIRKVLNQLLSTYNALKLKVKKKIENS
jgi:hypothetical protein